MRDRIVWYAVCFFLVGFFPSVAWMRWKVAEYLLAERRYICQFGYYQVRGVFEFGAVHECAEFIDEYRWIETGGLFWHPELFRACRDYAIDSRRVRELHCIDPYSTDPSKLYAPSVPYFSSRGRRPGDLFQDWSEVAAYAPPFLMNR